MRNSLLLLLSHSLIGTGFFFLYVHHIRSIYESRTNIAHLTQLEREALIRREDALYYSFYKTLVAEPLRYSTIEKLKNVTDIEYPQSVNVIQRFYVLPELAIAYFYNVLKDFSAVQRLFMLSCWRSPDLRVMNERCDIFAQPMQFYLEFVWLLGGLTILIIYMYGTLLSENIFGGIYAVVSYVMFHSYVSKIYERPMARENFAFPFIILQMFYLTICIQRMSKRREYNLSVSGIMNLILLTTIPLLCWQFSSIIFASQILIMMIQLGIKTIDKRSISFTIDYALSQLLGNALAYYYSGGSKKFIFSWQIGPAISLLFLGLVKRIRQRDLNFDLKKVALGIWLAISFQSFILRMLDKSGMGRTVDIYLELIPHWLFNGKVNFPTSLAACNPDFNSMDLIDLWELVKTLIVKPYCLYGVVMLAQFFRKWRKSSEQKNPSNDHIERAKNYVLEDFLEENHISMIDMTNKETENDLNKCLKLLEECDFDYERYKSEKSKQSSTLTDEHSEFMNNIKKLKQQIHNLQDKEQKDKQNKTKHLETTELLSEKQKETTADSNTSPSKNNTKQTGAANNCSKRTKTKNNISQRQTSSNRSPTRKSATENITEIDGNTTTGAAIIQNDFLSFHYVYSFIQMIVFTIMGLGVKKLFFLCFTQGCVIVPTICSKFWYRRQRSIFWTVSLAVFLTSLLNPGLMNVREEYFPKRSTQINDDLDTMLEWIKLNTERHAVFAGPIDIIGTVHMTTRRPIVNHAHLEMLYMSERTEHVYGVFSRQQSSDIYNQYSQLKIQYLIISLKDCTNEIKDDCDLLAIWDDIQPAYRKYPQFCFDLVNKNVPSFLKVFSNDYYSIIKMFSQSVQINLKYSRMPEKSI